MSPIANRRDDAWGGDAERRLAFPLAVVADVRRAIGDMPLVYRLSADEFRTGGLTIEDMEGIAPRWVAAGADAMHISKIGRASCREKVGMDVSIRVVAGTLTKKITNK